MPIVTKILSLQNPRVKDWIKLHKPRERRKTHKILIEGLREINMAIMHGLEVEVLVVSYRGNDLIQSPTIRQIINQVECVEVSDAVFEKLTYREQTDGLLAIAKPISRKLEDLQLRNNPLIVILEAVEKPGNLGAILRTCDAAMVDAMIVCEPTTDIYNPNVIRSSLGCVFSLPVVACTSQQACDWLKQNQIRSLATNLAANSWHYNADLTGPLAIIMGTEADGLSDFWLKQANEQIKIPMLGKVDSLNVSASTAIIVYEALRQRGVTQPL